MDNINGLIFNPQINFEKVALQIFQFQAKNNIPYKNYLEQLNVNPEEIKEITAIPFLPVQFFKSHKIIAAAKEQTIFTSSGTTGIETSKHYIADLTLYEQSFLKCFELFYSKIEEYCFLALLPSYMENENSSLLYMAESLIRKSKNSLSGFYLNDFEKLFNTVERLQNQKKKFILLGVTYALLDFAEYVKASFKKLDGSGIIMETGGMKGRRKEMIREEVHKILCDGFNVEVIHSEYGMTELLSQAYSKGKGIFKCPPWMKVFIRDVNDPASSIENEKTGSINIIELANVYSCSFITTQDLGKKYSDESFEVLGRFDESDLRGCNLLVS
jgi:phenylacetate-coenzyme A ligase PaaK-like adenylate-forming protein